MKTILRSMFLLTTLAALGTGCSLDASTDASTDDVLPLPAPIATADRAGAQVKIYELTPSNLAVVVTGEMPEGLEGKTPVELYEAIAAEAAPASLRERQEKIAAARAQQGERTGEGHQLSEGSPERSQVANLTAAQFQTSYCNPGSVDFDYCWPTSTNNFSIDFYNITWIHSHLNVYSGKATHRMLFRAFAGSWHLINTDESTGSSYVSTFDEEPNGDYDVQITNATGDSYHLAIHGDF